MTYILVIWTAEESGSILMPIVLDWIIDYETAKESAA